MKLDVLVVKVEVTVRMLVNHVDVNMSKKLVLSVVDGVE